MSSLASTLCAHADGPVVRTSVNRSREVPLRRLSGAHAVRIIDGGGCVVKEHSHDWPVISLYVSGGLENFTDVGEISISSPAAVLYGSGAAHSNIVQSDGFEQIQIEFDPRWLGADAQIQLSGPRHWVGGKVALAARELRRTWTVANASEAQLAEALKRFLFFALTSPAHREPPWLKSVVQRLECDSPVTASMLARDLGLNPHWLTQAYKAATGEGLGDTRRRKRVQRAATLLRETNLTAAEVAVASGFCDQSHMIRSCKAVLGRTPLQVRSEWLAF